MVKVSLVVFDMAGTTIQDKNEVLDCFTQAATANGLKATEARVNQMMGLPKRQVFEVLWQEQIGSDSLDYPVKVESSYQQFRQILEDYYRNQAIVPTEGCLETFTWLKTRGIKIALNTGFYREVTDIILNKLEWDSYIDISVTPSEIYANEGRPAPFMIQKAMYKLGISDPKQVIAVGDTPSDLAAAKNASCLLALGITTGTHSRVELDQHPHDGLIDSLEELKTIISNP
ncbi:HAD hydrolase-like protein [Gloeocapsa sp. PCC 73106]|uniref:HAD hydrolase-like protein n=1 Tax=Gloeocapsa sp. PCC 73106 TaxID=102232 RepID=UPI0002AC4884|nr:HAD hydrolase-like protein [Gloeocapsa sp. PCC 73106]ELR97838.1 putative phosphatase [Gloeocapsa sp. PCC 73106]